MEKIKNELKRKRPVTYSFSADDVAIFRELSERLDLPISRCLIFLAKAFLAKEKKLKK